MGDISFVLFIFFAFELSHLRPRAGEREEIEKNNFPFRGLSGNSSNVHWSSCIDRNAGCKAALRCRIRCLNRFSCCDLCLFITSGLESDFFDAAAVLLVRVCAALENKSDYHEVKCFLI